MRRSRQVREFEKNQTFWRIVVAMRTQDEFSQTTPAGQIRGTVTRHLVATPPALNVPYEGSDPQVRAAFPAGFSPSYGSGLAYKGPGADGVLEFYCLTDRGPNGDGPVVPQDGGTDSKLFPAPGFAPSIGVLQVNATRAVLVSSMPINTEAGVPVSGLPVPPGALGHSGEVPLFDALHFDPDGKAGFRASGIDSEAIAFDPIGKVLWVTDEYGPFLLNIDPVTGTVRQRYGPGAGLPAVLAKRRPNRGMEGMTFDPATGLVHAFLQSPLSDGKAHYALTGREEKVERYAAFLRWIVFDPASERTLATLAYPLDAAAYAKGRTGNAKLGDMVALGNGKFIVIEQGEGANGALFNHLMLVDTAGASDISAYGSELERGSMRGSADWAAVLPLRKTLLLDLNRIGWTAEKAEGLALADGHTLAISNDNDFGMQTRMFDAHGAELDGADVTGVTVDAAGRIVDGAASDARIRVAPGAPDARALSLWVLRFAQPLTAL